MMPASWTPKLEGAILAYTAGLRGDVGLGADGRPWNMRLGQPALACQDPLNGDGAPCFLSDSFSNPAPEPGAMCLVAVAGVAAAGTCGRGHRGASRQVCPVVLWNPHVEEV